MGQWQTPSIELPSFDAASPIQNCTLRRTDGGAMLAKPFPCTEDYVGSNPTAST